MNRINEPIMNRLNEPNMNRLNEPNMNRLNEPIMNQIEVSTTVFNKIYRFTEIHYGNISKSFIYITVEVEIYENENDNFDTEDADAHLVKMTDSHHSIASKNIKKIPLQKQEEYASDKEEEYASDKEEEEYASDNEEEEEANHNSDCNHDSNNPIKPKYSLNLNKINNIVNAVKMETHKKIKKVPIKKKINIIIDKITNKLQSELMKEYMNYILVLENNSKKQKGSYVDKLNAFYHVILNKIESSL